MVKDELDIKFEKLVKGWATILSTLYRTEIDEKNRKQFYNLAEACVIYGVDFYKPKKYSEEAINHLARLLYELREVLPA